MIDNNITYFLDVRDKLDALSDVIPFTSVWAAWVALANSESGVLYKYIFPNTWNQYVEGNWYETNDECIPSNVLKAAGFE